MRRVGTLVILPPELNIPAPRAYRPARHLFPAECVLYVIRDAPADYRRGRATAPTPWRDGDFRQHRARRISPIGEPVATSPGHAVAS